MRRMLRKRKLGLDAELAIHDLVKKSFPWLTKCLFEYASILRLGGAKALLAESSA